MYHSRKKKKKKPKTQKPSPKEVGVASTWNKGRQPCFCHSYVGALQLPLQLTLSPTGCAELTRAASAAPPALDPQGLESLCLGQSPFGRRAHEQRPPTTGPEGEGRAHPSLPTRPSQSGPFLRQGSGASAFPPKPPRPAPGPAPAPPAADPSPGRRRPLPAAPAHPARQGPAGQGEPGAEREAAAPRRGWRGRPRGRGKITGWWPVGGGTPLLLAPLKNPHRRAALASRCKAVRRLLPSAPRWRLEVALFLGHGDLQYIHRGSQTPCSSGAGLREPRQALRQSLAFVRQVMPK